MANPIFNSGLPAVSLKTMMLTVADLPTTGGGTAMTTTEQQPGIALPLSTATQQCDDNDDDDVDTDDLAAMTTLLRGGSCQKNQKRIQHDYVNSRIAVIAINTISFVTGITNLLWWLLYIMSKHKGNGNNGTIHLLQNDEIAMTIFGVLTNGLLVGVASLGLRGGIQKNKILVLVATLAYSSVTLCYGMLHIWKVVMTTGTINFFLGSKIDLAMFLIAVCLVYPHHVLLKQYSQLETEKKRT